MADENGFLILPGSGGDYIVYNSGIIVATFHGVKLSSDEPRKMAELFIESSGLISDIVSAYHQMQAGFNPNAGNLLVTKFMERKKQ